MVRIVTDSTANLPAEVASHHRIAVVPLRVVFPTATYRDGVDITTSQFYRLLSSSTSLPTTSQPPAAEFEAVLRETLDAGEDAVVVTISERLSGTYASAVTAMRQFPGERVAAVDSRTTGSALALMVLAAAEMAAAGAPLSEVTRALETMRDRMQVLFVVSTLEYLQKGGRIGGAAALAGALLSIKPVLMIRDGRVEAWGKVRGRRKSLQTAIEAIAEGVGTGPSVRAAVMHAACEEEAGAVASELQSVLGCSAPSIYELSPVIGVHVGPGTIGVAAYDTTSL